LSFPTRVLGMLGVEMDMRLKENPPLQRRHRRQSNHNYTFRRDQSLPQSQLSSLRFQILIKTIKKRRRWRHQRRDSWDQDQTSSLLLQRLLIFSNNKYRGSYLGMRNMIQQAVMKSNKMWGKRDTEGMKRCHKGSKAEKFLQYPKQSWLDPRKMNLW
jgi:hypothetical protein